MKPYRYLGIPLLFLITPSAHALSFNLISGSGITAQYQAGFNAAANLWSSIFKDPVTVNINIDIQSLGAGTLGSANTSRQSYSYSQIHTALTNDMKSVFDATAVANLQPGPNIDFVLNRTSDNPNGAGSATPYIDNGTSSNNSTISITTANAKALGLATSATSDANITFSSNFSWDFDTSNGVTGGAFDFVGVAAHEIGHALGFISHVDILDTNSSGPTYLSGNTFANSGAGLTTLDLYRYSTLSCVNGVIDGIQDWSADTRVKYFSIDGCTTNEGTFSTGRIFGDGRQASHWKDSLSLGLMDPTLSLGETGVISALDIKVFDVIGWDTVPTPPIAWLVIPGLIGLFRMRKNHLPT